MRDRAKADQQGRQRAMDSSPPTKMARLALDRARGADLCQLDGTGRAGPASGAIGLCKKPGPQGPAVLTGPMA